ncbi:hypothetical protein [Heliorestis acidaminivorans]|nr:hypothetical protein [Heliorestis acidaminivorans]
MRKMKKLSVTYDSWESAMEDFLFQKESENLRPRTIEDYRSHISRFFRNHPEAFSGSKQALTTAVKEHFSGTKSNNYFNGKLRTLSPFFRWLHSQGVIPCNPLENIKGKKQTNRIVELSTETLKELLQ